MKSFSAERPSLELRKYICEYVVSSSLSLKPEDFDLEVFYDWGPLVDTLGFFIKERCREVLKARKVKPEPKYKVGDKLYWCYWYNESVINWESTTSTNASCVPYKYYLIKYFVVTEIEYLDGHYIYNHTAPGYAERPTTYPSLPEYECYFSVVELEEANPIELPDLYINGKRSPESWEACRELVPALREYIKQINWREHPGHFGSGWYNPEGDGSVSSSIQGWSLYFKQESYSIETIEDLNFYLGSPIKLGPPEIIKRIRAAYEQEGFLVVAKPYVQFRNNSGNCWAFEYICPVCRKHVKPKTGGLQGHGKGGNKVPYSFEGGFSVRHAGCTRFVTGDCHITEEAYVEYRKYYQEP